MMKGLLDRTLEFEARHTRMISIGLVAWLAISSAAYARFITLPAIPFVPDQALFWLPVALNAGWWGFLRPALERRRKDLAAAEEARSDGALKGPGS